MKRVFIQIGRFFRSWDFLKVILVLGLLVVFLGWEEDWRGARDWARTKAEWEAKGVSLDRRNYVPPSVPDDQNLAAIPLFKRGTDKTDADSYHELVTLRQAMCNAAPGNQIPPMGGGMRGDLPDWKKIHDTIASDYAAAFKNTEPPKGALAQFDALYPFLAELRDAATTRPYFRLEQDYIVDLPAGRPLGPVTDQIKVGKLLEMHALLALEDHQPDLALSDMTTNLQIASGVMQDPSLVGGLVGIGMVAIGQGTIYNGLALHAWNDGQLVQIQDELAKIDFLKNFQFVMRSEVVMDDVPNMDFIKNYHRAELKKSPDVAFTQKYYIWRDGWLDENKTQIAAAFFKLAETVDPKTHRIFTKAADDLLAQSTATKEHWIGFAPWNLFYTVSVGPVMNAAHHYAEAQVFWIDEARIAIALERYRLVHGVYPDSLQALVPACIPELPHDIINGEPYRYRLLPDGTYLLYSVGWNQVDDGGKMVFKKEPSYSIESNQGDWVWPVPHGETPK
jgi:hypothetical protein